MRRWAWRRSDVSKITRLPAVPVVERLVLAVVLDPYFDIPTLADYASISKRKIQTYLNLPVNALPHYEHGTRKVVRCSDYDRWAQQYRKVGVPVEEKIKRLQARHRREKKSA